MHMNISPDAERLCSRLLARPLKYHALKRCTFWRETCLASAIALWLVNQRARAANRLLRLVPSQLKAGEQKQKVCLSIQTSFALVFMEQNHSLGHLTRICSARALARGNRSAEIIISYNYHTHTSFCDGNNTLEEMTLAAIAAGLKVIGFSGHSYTAYDDCYCMSQANTAAYFAEIGRLREQYRGRITILRGIEQDFGSDEPTDAYDYVIGSVHASFAPAVDGSGDNFHGFDRSRFYYIDWTVDRILEAVRDDFAGDPYAFIEHYYETVGMLPKVTGCHIIGHFDLVTKFNEKQPWFDENHPRYRAAACRALDRIFASWQESRGAARAGSAPIFEINTGAISRGWRTTPYPAPWILQEIRARGGQIMINSDSHAVDTLTCAFPDAVKLALDCGFTRVKIITEQGFEDYSLI